MKRQITKSSPPAVVKPYVPKGSAGIPKANDINQMSSEEIRENLLALKFAQMSLHAKRGQKGAMDNPLQIRNNRRTIARMMTVLVQRGERCV